ncbi:hypothetical protein [Corynebacterium sp. 335C]
MSAGRRLDERLRRAARGDGDGRLRILAVVIGPRRTSAATWTPGAVDCPAVRIGDGPNGSMPSAVAWDGTGYVVGHAAERLIAAYPAAGVASPSPLMGRKTAQMAGGEVPVDELVAAILRHVLHAAGYRAGDGTVVVIARPRELVTAGDRALMRGARLAGVPDAELVLGDLPGEPGGADDPMAAAALALNRSDPRAARRLVLRRAMDGGAWGGRSTSGYGRRLLRRLPWVFAVIILFFIALAVYEEAVKADALPADVPGVEQTWSVAPPEEARVPSPGILGAMRPEPR